MRLLKLVQTVLSLEHSPIPKTQLFALLGFAAATVILAPLIPDPDPDYYHSEYVSPTAADADDDKIFDKIHNSRMRYLEMTANDSGTDEDIPDDSPDLIDSEFADDDIENIFQDAFSKGSGKEQQETEAEEDQNELDWLDYTVKEDDNLSTIFNTLNLPQKTLFMLLKTDKTKTLTRLKIGQKLHFLIDRNGNLLSLAISMFSSENEVIYVYDSRNDRYISYTDPAGTYQQADLERLVKEPQTDPATYAQSDTDSSFTEEEIKEYEKDEEKAEAEEEAAKAKEEQEKAEKEKAEKEAKEKAEKEKAEKEKAEKEKAEKEKAEKEKAEKEAKETAKEKAEREKAEKEKAEKEAREKAEREKAEKEKAEKEAKEKAAREKSEKEKAEKERKERENAEKIQREMEKQQRVEEAKRSSKVLMGTITRGIFITDAKKAGLTSPHISRIIKIYKGRINFRRDLRKGDSFRVLFDRPSGDKNARIMAVSFTTGGKTIALYRAKNGMFYPENGVSPTVSKKSSGGGMWRYPMPNNKKVSSPFNPHRWHPIRGIYRPHYGTDFTAPIGTKVYAPANGTVLKTSYQRGGAGYYIIIKHAGGYSTVYMHLSKALVRTGQKVSQGQVIALSGNTGGSTGPHLHYEVRINGRAVDAMRVDLPGGSSRETVSIDWNASKEFANDVAGYKGQLSRAVVIDESNAEQFLNKDSQTAKTQSGKSGKAGKASSSGKAGKSGKASSSEKKGSGKASSSKKGSGKASSSKKGSGKASASGKKGSGKASSGKKGSGKASSSKKASGKASSGRKQSKGSSKSSGRKIQKK